MSTQAVSFKRLDFSVTVARARPQISVSKRLPVPEAVSGDIGNGVQTLQVGFPSFFLGSSSGSQNGWFGSFFPGGW